MLDPWKNPAIWHAINVHLPIVLAILGLPLVCVVAITRGRSRGLRWGTVLFYAVVALAAWFTVQTGERAMNALPPTISAAAAERIGFHERLAEKLPILAAVTALLLLLANIPRRTIRQTFTTLALVLSVVTAAWVAVTAHSGGLAVYEHGLGTVAMSQNQTAPALAQSTGPVTGHDATLATQPTVATAANVVPGTTSVSYTKDIKPLLANKCAECHSATESKGGFDASNIAAILKGGKKAGAGFIAGRPDDSSIIQYVEGKKQPQMPKGGTKLSDADIAKLRQWVAAGAMDDSNGAAAAKVVAVVPGAPSAVPPAAPSTQETISADWDPQVQFNANESVAVRRFVRLKNLKPAPKPPAVGDAKVFNVIDQFIVAKWPPAASAKPQAAFPATATQPVASPAVATSAVAAPAVAAPAVATVATAAPTTATQTPATPTPVASAVATPAGAAPVVATQPADTALCDDATFSRRVYLDVVGVIPTAGEARSFVDDKDPKKREKLVDTLLGRTKDYAGNWVPFWEEALCSNGLHQGGVGTHGNYRQWIFSSFDANKPYDTMVQELLDPTMPNHPARYVLNDNHMRTVQSSADTAQVFLGTAIKCASCHSHFLNDEWPQARAVAFAGFFADKDMEVIRCERKSGTFVSTHFMFDLPAAPTTAPADQNQRLHQVAQLITDPTNPRFAKTIVNRLWKRYMGLGLFEPADDYREDTPASHPELLDWLADDFIRHGFDVKRTIRLMLTSRTYQLRYDALVEDHFDIAKPKDPRYFRSPGLRRVTAEQLLDSIDVTMKQAMPEPRAFQNDVSSPLTRALGKPPVRNEVSTARPDDTAVVQSLELLNGEEFHTRVYKGDLVTNASVQPKTDQLIDDVYWSALGRAPSENEKLAATEFLKSAPPPATTQPVEVVWLEDAIPPRVATEGAWKFVGAPDVTPFSGKLAHTTEDPQPPGPTQHLFTGAKLPVSPVDVLFAYVYIDPANPPKEIMLQFMAGGAWLRATWGSEDIPFGEHVAMGALPKTGEWVRLQIPAAKIGITKPTVITGLAFTQFNGKVYWDKSGATKGPPIHDPETIGDMLWALFASPEFQYIR